MKKTIIALAAFLAAGLAYADEISLAPGGNITIGHTRISCMDNDQTEVKLPKCRIEMSAGWIFSIYAGNTYIAQQTDFWQRGKGMRIAMSIVRELQKNHVCQRLKVEQHFTRNDYALK